MKLKLPLFLLQAVLLLQSSFAANVTLESNDGPHDFKEDTIVNTEGDSLLYTFKEGESPNLPFFQSSANLTFEGAYSFGVEGYSSFRSSFMDLSKNLSFQNMKNIVFKKNRQGGRFLEVDGGLAFENIGNILIEENFGNVGVAFISSDDAIRFTKTNDITISHNFCLGAYGIIESKTGIHFLNAENVVFSYNEGCSVLWSPQIIFNNIKSLSIEGNSGELATIRVEEGLLKIQNSGEVKFLNNHAKHIGGAIYIYGNNWTPTNVLISADNGNIVFQGNTHARYTTAIANAIFIEGNEGRSSFSLRAASGREIVFFDPVITFSNLPWINTFINMTLNASKEGTDYDGIIRFDGSKVATYSKLEKGVNESDDDYKKRLDDSRYSNILGNTSLEGGSLILTNEVVYGRKLNELQGNPITEFSFQKGFLAISNKSQLNATNFTVEGISSVFRMDNSSSINATTFTASQGLSFDVDYWLNNADANVMIKAENYSFGGVIGIHDRFDTYSDNQWANTMKFNLINADQIEDSENVFSGIQSNTTGSALVDDPYQHSGIWSYEWVGTQLVATWSSTGGIKDVHPELEGNIVSNSMWSSASNAKSLSSAALGNVNILRLKSELQNNFWLKGIGDFAYDDSSAELDGYSYQGGGYAAGADFKIAKQSILGVAFGQLIGHNKSELYNAKIKQDSMMGSIYGAHLQTLNKSNSLLWTLAGTYGDTENSMSTHYSDGQNSSGTWNNNTYFLEAQLEWRIAPEGKNWTYKPFIGVEYTDVTMESFTETGDKVRHFGEGSYKSLSLPIGMGIEHQSRFGHKTWLNALSLAYVPDVYREAPSTQATRLSNGFSWKDQGSKANIHTLRATINSTLQFNAAWTAYAGYTFEARGGASYHNVNTGVSYSF